eukprot:1218191-Rhodomonas_salina.4
MSGTDIPSTALRICYAMSGTDWDYVATRLFFALVLFVIDLVSRLCAYAYRHTIPALKRVWCHLRQY